eukprot:12837152-Alexandrium_andersonii.AAC.1
MPAYASVQPFLLCTSAGLLSTRPPTSAAADCSGEQAERQIQQSCNAACDHESSRPQTARLGTLRPGWFAPPS